MSTRVELSCLTDVPFRGSDALRRGDLTRHRLRGPEFVRLAPDVHVGAAVEVDARIRMLVLDRWSRGLGVVAGPLAALGWRADCPWDTAEVLLGTPRRTAPPGVVVRGDRPLPGEVGTRHGVPITTPARTAFDLARRSPLVEAVAAVDALGFRCGVTAADVRAVAERHPGARGLSRLPDVLALVDPLAQSLMESRIRVGLLARGVPPAVSQYPVDLADGTRAFLDLAWPCPPRGRRPVGLEYDGEEHRSVTRRGRDLRRHGLLDDRGWDVQHVTALQAYREIDTLAARLLRKLT